MANNQTKIAEVLIEEEDVVAEPAPEPEVVTVDPATKSARIKGTWTMYWGQSRWNFVDGQRYNLPPDLFDYLRKSGNIYDTL